MSLLGGFGAKPNTTAPGLGDPLQQGADTASSLFPGGQIGKAIGNTLGTGFVAGQELLKGNPDIAGNLMKGAATENGNNFEPIVGDATQAVLLPATAAMGGGTDAIAGAGQLAKSVGASSIADTFSGLASRLSGSFLGRMAASAGAYGLSGAGLGASGAMAKNESAGDVLGAGIKGAATGAAGGAAAQGAGEAVNALDTSGASATLMNKVARINPSDAENFSHMSGGVTPGQYLDQRGIYGSAPSVTSQLYQRFTQAKGAVDDALSQLPGLYKNQAVETALKDVVQQAESTSAEGAPSPYLTQAQALLGKAQSGGLNMSEVNDAKRLYEGTVKLNYIKDQVASGIERANNIDSSIRSWQQDTATKLGFTNIQKLNKETQLAKSLIDALGKKANAQLGNNLVGLTDWIVASHIPADPSSLALLLGKHVFTSGAGQGALAKLLSSGEALAAPSADIGAMNTNPDTLGLPGAGETAAGSNLPPVIHAKAGGLNPADKQGAIWKGN